MHSKSSQSWLSKWLSSGAIVALVGGATTAFAQPANSAANPAANPAASAAAPSASTASPAALAAQAEEPDPLRLPVQAGGLTADRAAQLAAQSAPAVLQASASLRHADETARVATAAFLPRLDLRASYTRLGEIDQQPIDFGGMQISLAPSILNTTQLNATARVPVSDYFFTIAPGYQASKKAADVARAQLEAQREVAAFTARQYFYVHVRATAAELVAGTAVQQLESAVADLDALVKAGTATRGDLLQAQAQLANARVELSASQGQVRTSADQLRITLGLEAGASLALGEDVLAARPAAEPPPSELEARALRDRPEVSALRALIAANQLSVRVEKGRQLPSLSVTGAYDYANPNARVFPQEEKFSGSWSAGVVLSWSPNDAIARRADISRAELEVSRARTDLLELERRIRTEASQASNDLHVAREQLAAAEQGVAAAREAWRVQRDLLGAGEATAQQALDAQAALTRAQQSVIDAQISARIASARADYVVGRATPK